MTDHVNLRTPEGRAAWDRLQTGAPAVLPTEFQQRRKRVRRDEMNTTEARYAAMLESQKRVGIIVDWKFEAIIFTLAPKTTYTPDFFVHREDGLWFIETKGHLEDDAAVKFKIAREQHQWASWAMVRWDATKGWVTVRI